MLESPRSRVVALVVLFGVLSGMVVWYGSLEPAPEQGAYPSGESFLSAPDEYLGERVTITGLIVDEDPVRIRVENGAGPAVVLTVTGVDHPVRENAKLRVFGRLTTPRQIEATSSFTVPQSGLLYTYAVSFLSGLWVFGRIVRWWRYDPDAVGLAPRGEPFGPGLFQSEDGDDA